MGVDAVQSLTKKKLRSQSQLWHLLQKGVRTQPGASPSPASRFSSDGPKKAQTDAPISLHSRSSIGVGACITEHWPFCPLVGLVPKRLASRDRPLQGLDLEATNRQ